MFFFLRSIRRFFFLCPLVCTNQVPCLPLKSGITAECYGFFRMSVELRRNKAFERAMTLRNLRVFSPSGAQATSKSTSSRRILRQVLNARSAFNPVVDIVDQSYTIALATVFFYQLRVQCRSTVRRATHAKQYFLLRSAFKKWCDKYLSAHNRRIQLAVVRKWLALTQRRNARTAKIRQFVRILHAHRACRCRLRNLRVRHYFRKWAKAALAERNLRSLEKPRAPVRVLFDWWRRRTEIRLHTFLALTHIRGRLLRYCFRTWNGTVAKRAFVSTPHAPVPGNGTAMTVHRGIVLCRTWLHWRRRCDIRLASRYFVHRMRMKILLKWLARFRQNVRSIGLKKFAFVAWRTLLCRRSLLNIATFAYQGTITRYCFRKWRSTLAFRKSQLTRVMRNILKAWHFRMRSKRAATVLKNQKIRRAFYGWRQVVRQEQQRIASLYLAIAIRTEVLLSNCLLLWQRKFHRLRQYRQMEEVFDKKRARRILAEKFLLWKCRN